MTRPKPRELCCPGCGSGQGVDEHAAHRTSQVVHSCTACCARFTATAQGTSLVEEATESDAGGGTLRIRAVPPGPRPVARALAVGMALPEGMSLALEVGDGPSRGRIFHVDRRMVVLGREEGEILIPDPMMSRRHATLEIHDMDTIILRDLSSTNGTYHNDQLIAFCKVQDGDEIRLGSTVLTVSVDLIG